MRVAVAGEGMPLWSNEAHGRQPSPESGKGFQVNQLKPCQLFHFRWAAGEHLAAFLELERGWRQACFDVE